MTEHEDLIAEARGPVHVMRASALVEELADALEKVTVERDNWKLSAEEAERAEQRAEKRAEEAERERDALGRSVTEQNDTIAKLEHHWAALAAVVERAKGWATMRVPGFTVENQMAEVADALMGAPSVALDRVKAEARRDALLAEAEALEHYEHIWAPDGGVYLGHITGLIRRDADRIEKGESNE